MLQTKKKKRENNWKRKKKSVTKEEVMKALKQIIGVGGQTGVYSCAYLDISQGTKTAREMN